MGARGVLGALILVGGVSVPAVTGAQDFSLVALEPAVVAPYQGFDLVLAGHGFEPGVVVRIEGSSPGRFLRYEPRALTPQRCEVALALGFGPRPASRRVYLEGSDGRRTEMLVLEIRRPQSVPVPDSEIETNEQTTPAPEENELAAGDEVPRPEIGPSIAELSPSPLRAGWAGVLEVSGENFTEHSTVWVRVNVNAGSSRLPEYELKAFDTLFVDAGLLEVEFDRGFYPVPGVRDVVVENPGGVRSAPAVLTIEREDPE